MAASGIDIDSLPPLRQVIADHGLDARKGLGQNFLLDLNLTAKIARAAAPLDRGTVIEVGPGPGGLTRALLAAGAARVVAIEKDPRCVAALAPLAERAGGRLTVTESDALGLDYAALGPPPRRIVANLPYNIATPLLIGWLRRADLFESLVLMFQREVADRITAEPASEAYGRLSVIANWRCETERIMTLPARAFTPPPKVDSAVVRLTPRVPPPSDCGIEALERVTAAAFGQRRKMLRRSLKGLGGDVPALLDAAGAEPTARAETLSVDQFAAMARALEARGTAAD